MDIKHIKELQRQLNIQIAKMINAYQKETSVRLTNLEMHPVQNMDGYYSNHTMDENYDCYITSKIEL